MVTIKKRRKEVALTVSKLDNWLTNRKNLCRAEKNTRVQIGGIAYRVGFVYLTVTRITIPA